MAYQLLAISEKWMSLQQGVVDFFSNFNALYAIEIILFFCLIFFVSKVLRDNDATRLVFIYWFMIFAGGALHVVDSELIGKQFFLVYLVLISAVMLILFSVEVKKYFWDMHNTKRSATEKTTGTEVVSRADTERCINNIVKALQNMSKNNVGALIVLSKGALPKQVIQSGVDLNADISTQLIEGVFFPKAPLHDGAMIIEGHKIRAAGCFLPLTQKTQPKEYGTRHRAAIGITDSYNVISLVVSEETGIISIVKGGKPTRYADYDMLIEALKDYYWQEMPITDKSSKGGRK